MIHVSVAIDKDVVQQRKPLLLTEKVVREFVVAVMDVFFFNVYLVLRTLLTLCLNIYRRKVIVVLVWCFCGQQQLRFMYLFCG